jgi:hypothetical protein
MQCDFNNPMQTCPICTFDIRIIPHGNERSIRSCDGRPMPHRKYTGPWPRPDTPQPPSIIHQAGPGTELKKLLARPWWKFEASPSCPCNARAAEMDRQGPAWCRENLSTITGWLREEITRRKKAHDENPAEPLPKAIVAFGKLPATLQESGLRAIVMRAIRNAERAAD